MLFALSLGHLGDKKSFLIALDANSAYSDISMYCDTGVIGSVTKFGFARDKSDGGVLATYVESSYCKMTLSDYNKNSVEDCYDETSCTASIKIDYKPDI